MSKVPIEEILKDALEQAGLELEKSKEQSKLDNYNKKLESENERLKDRIDKAIEYIEKHACYNEEEKTCKCGFSNIALNSLLSILKGKE